LREGGGNEQADGEENGEESSMRHEVLYQIGAQRRLQNSKAAQTHASCRSTPFRRRDVSEVGQRGDNILAFPFQL